jgi:cytochrome P450
MVGAASFGRLLLVVAPWPLVRALATPSFRRLQGPRKTAKYGGFLALYALVFVAALLLHPPLAGYLALVAALGTMAELWVVRAGSGRRAGLPPGRLSLMPIGSVTDRDYLLKHLDHYGPVAKAVWPWSGHPMVCLRGLRRGATVLREHSADIAWGGMGFDPLIPAGFIRSMTPEDHAHYKAILRRAYADEAVEACGEQFSHEARRAIAELAAVAEHEPNSRLDPRPTLGRITVRSYARLFLGVIPGSDECELLENLLLDPGPFYALPAADDPRFEELRDGATVAAGIAKARSLEPGDPAVASSFLGKLVRDDPHALDDPNTSLNFVFQYATASRDVTGLLQWIVKMLGDNPSWISRVRSSSDDLDRRVVMETLRLAQSEYIARKVLKPFEIEGYQVPRDWWLRVCVNESHRDPAVFESPETFDPDRFADRRYTVAEYAPFGMFEHACLGVPTTHALASRFVHEYCEYDWVVCDDGEPEYDGFHWIPSRRLAVTLR